MRTKQQHKKRLHIQCTTRQHNHDEFHSVLCRIKLKCVLNVMLETIQSDDCNPQNNYKSPFLFFSLIHTQTHTYTHKQVHTFFCTYKHINVCAFNCHKHFLLLNFFLITCYTHWSMNLKSFIICVCVCMCTIDILISRSQN